MQQSLIQDTRSLEEINHDEIILIKEKLDNVRRGVFQRVDVMAKRIGKLEEENEVLRAKLSEFGVFPHLAGERIVQMKFI